VCRDRSESSEPVVVIDSREQQPYEFEGAVVKALPVGDYSVLGLEDRVAVERKSHGDAYRSLGYERGRFEREVEKLASYEFAAIVIEASLPEFLRPPIFSRVHPRSAIGSLLAWCVRFRLPVLFCGDRAHAEATTWHLLHKFAKYAEERSNG
jgi:DNA excision repair protein ERCC-4